MKILVKTPYFGDRPYTVEALQPLLPFPILSVSQGSFEFTLEVDASITQEQADACAKDIRAYVLENLVTAKIIADS